MLFGRRRGKSLQRWDQHLAAALSTNLGDALCDIRKGPFPQRLCQFLGWSLSGWRRILPSGDVSKLKICYTGPSVKAKCREFQIPSFKWLLWKKAPAALHKQSAPPQSIVAAHQGDEPGSFLFCDQFAFNHLHVCVCVCWWRWRWRWRVEAEEMWSIAGSMRLCLHLFVLVRLTLPSTTVHPSVQRGPGAAAAAARRWTSCGCERWGLAQRMFVLPAGKHWQKRAHTHLMLAGHIVFFFYFFFLFIFPTHPIVLFTFPFQTRENTAACAHPANQSWSLAGRAGIDLLCLEDGAWFPLFFFFHSPVGREMLVLSPFLLRPNKSSRQPLTLWPMVPLTNLTEGLAMNRRHWCL